MASPSPVKLRDHLKSIGGIDKRPQTNTSPQMMDIARAAQSVRDSISYLSNNQNNAEEPADEESHAAAT